MSQEEPLIRPATPDDATALARLRYGFRAALGEATEDEAAFVARCTDWMQAELSSGRWVCWVVHYGGAIAGHLWLHLIDKIPNPVAELERHAYISNVFVRDDLRAQGLGSRLMDTALAHCRQHAVDSVILWPTARSRTLYQRHGFEVRDDIMEANLDIGRELG